MGILDKIRKGNSNLPPRVALSGVQGVGKSTLASNAPSPLFICPEDGLTGLDHVDRLTPTTFNELHAILDSIIESSNGYKTIVIDTVDWMERLVYDHICTRDNKKNIEDYGWSKGYVVAENELVGVLRKLDTIRHKHSMWIILLSHVKIKSFNDPAGETWDRYEMKGHHKMTGVVSEWVDACLFAFYEVFKTKNKDGREKAIGGDRVVKTQWNPAYDAKNRLNLPETLPLDWTALVNAIAENNSQGLVAQIKTAYATAKIADTDKPKWEKFIASLDKQSPDKLKGALEKLNTLQ